MKDAEAMAAIRDVNVMAQARSDGIDLPADEDIFGRRNKKVSLLYWCLVVASYYLPAHCVRCRIILECDRYEEVENFCRLVDRQRL